ncbi:MAG: YbaB/EbfC family nucleoid-associated protein [Actinobacteria bacterium]|nr:YbaB/EbfC family nucleoid-associated protein [Actinomycetota bacterium]
MKPDFNKMMKQVQKMQKDMAKAQEELASEKFQASAGGGAVSVAVNGQFEVLEIKIDESLLESKDVEMLQDLIMVAVNEALKQAQDKANQRLGQLTGGLNIPGLM